MVVAHFEMAIERSLRVAEEVAVVAQKVSRAPCVMLSKSSLRAEAVIAVVTDEMIVGIDPVLMKLMIGIKVPLAGEAIAMVFVLPEVVQQSSA